MRNTIIIFSIIMGGRYGARGALESRPVAHTLT